MKAFLIDPYEATIKEVQYKGDYNEIYDLIDAEIFTCVSFNEEEDNIFIDDEGMINGKDQAFFRVIDTPAGDTYPLIGKGLVLGTNEDGESVEPKITLEQLKKQVQFIPAVLIHQFI